jgi:signal transduction histidine kinase/ActR/RegA family two-component response regulator
MSDSPESVGAPTLRRYTLELLGWRSLVAAAVFGLYAAWGLHVVTAARRIQRDAAQRVTWIAALQESQHAVLTHDAEDPAVRQALAHIAKVAEERRAARTPLGDQGVLIAAVEELGDALYLPGVRDDARTALVGAIDHEMKASFTELSELTRWETFRWEQLQYLALSAIGLASLAMAALLLARHRRLMAERMGERLELAAREALLARREAQRASRAKSRFLATVSHELRTPMTAILGTVELLGRQDLSPRQAHYMAAIRSAGETLQSLIEDVLDLSRIEAGKLELVAEDIPLAAMLDDLAVMFAGRAVGKGLFLAVQAGPGLPATVRGDPLRLRQVLVNLVGNAIKFTERGSVCLTAFPTPCAPGRLTFEVTDTGPGLTPEQAATLFQPFTQVDSSMTRAHGGAGLGLAISRHLAEAMQGTLEVVSQPGAGARFVLDVAVPTVREATPPRAPGPIVLLGDGPALDALAALLRANGLAPRRATGPTARDALPATSALEPAGILVLSHDVSLPDEVSTLLWRVFRLEPFGADESIPREPGIRPLVEPIRPALATALFEPTMTWSREPAQAPVHAGHRVLVVDDHEMNRLVLAEMLVTLGCRVGLASGGLQALERLAAEPWALVLMDAEMPDLDGFETTRRLRAAGHRRPQTAIVGLSGHVTPEHRAQGLQAGMDDYLAKPIQLATLERTVQRWCGEG